MRTRQQRVAGGGGKRIRTGMSVAGLAGESVITPGDIADLDLWLRADQSVSTNGSRDFANATNEYFAIADNADLSVEDEDFTFAIWVYPDVNLLQRVIAGHYGASPNRSWFLQRASSNLVECFYSTDGTSAQTKSFTGGTLTQNAWNFVVFYHDHGTEYGVHVNNATATTKAETAGIHDSPLAFEIGRITSGGTLEWDGRMCRCGFWKRLLTSAEKTWLYNSGAGRAYGSLGQSGTDGSDLTTNLQAYWNMAESSGNAIDAHSTHDLTDTNTVTAAAGPGADTNPTDQDTVSAWTAIDGSAQSFVQSTVSKRPIYVASAMNSKPAILFDGTDDLLVRAERYLTSTSGTIFIVLRATTEAADDYMFSMSDQAAANDYMVIQNLDTNGPGVNAVIGGTSDLVDGNDNLGTSDGILSVSSDGTRYRMRVNGLNQNLNVIAGGDNGDWFGDVSAADNMVIGALKHTSETGHFPGEIAEIIHYDAELSELQKAQVASYLADRYGITI